MKTNTKAPTQTLDERYHDARTMQGLEEALRGEGYNEDEVRTRMEERIKASHQS